MCCCELMKLWERELLVVCRSSLMLSSSLVSSYSVTVSSNLIIKSTPLHWLVHWTFCLSLPHHCNDRDC